MTLRAYPILTLILAGALAGCVLPVDQRGNLPPATDISQIKPGSTDKETVTRLLGSPSSVAAFDGDTWYYISRQTKQVAFFQPEVLDAEVTAIHFNKDGIVADINHRSLHDMQAMNPDPNATPASGRKYTFLEQLIGNFGKFTPAGSGTGGGSGPGGGSSGVP